MQTQVPAADQEHYGDDLPRCRTMKGAILLTSAAVALLTVFAAPGRAAQVAPCPDALSAPCERPLPPPCTPVELPCQR